MKRAIKKCRNKPPDLSNIHNLSSHKLTIHETKVLERGLNYVIASNKKDYITHNLEYIDRQ